MKKKNIVRILFMFVMLLAMMPAFTSEAKAKKAELNAGISNAGKKTIVSVYWSKIKKSEKIEVYRANANFAGKRTGKFKKIATLPASAPRYLQVVSSKKNYSYKIKAYKKKKNKKVYTYTSNEVVACIKDKLEFSVSRTSATEVELDISVDSPMKYNKEIEIYRKEENGAYELIQTIKMDDGDNDDDYYREWIIDKAVKTGVNYSYKARTVGVKKDVKQYSAFSKEVVAKPLNLSDKYEYECLTESGMVSDIKVKLTSNQYNRAGITLSTKEATYYTRKTSKDEMNNITLVLAQYSTDGINWKNVSADGVKLNPGKTIYLSYKSTNKKPFGFHLDEYTISELEMPATEVYHVTINFLRNTVK